MVCNHQKNEIRLDFCTSFYGMLFLKKFDDTMQQIMEAINQSNTKLPKLYFINIIHNQEFLIPINQRT